jgi:hypothetical protein
MMYMRAKREEEHCCPYGNKTKKEAAQKPLPLFTLMAIYAFFPLRKTPSLTPIPSSRWRRKRRR